MQVHFVKASPCRNTTVFMEGDIPRSAYSGLGRLSMDADYLAAEQAGFLVKPKNSSSVLRLEMAGGEFCGNATLALGALAVQRGLAGTGGTFAVECSGASMPLTCCVTKSRDGHYEVSAEMPLTAKVRPFMLEAGGKSIAGGLVELPGIAHFCTEAKLSEEMYDALMDVLEKSCENDAFGIIAYENTDASEYRIRPYVSVPSEGSRFFEQACGSGSLSLGLWLKQQGLGSRIKVLQPGGVLAVDVCRDVPSIAADVYFPCEGEMWVEDALFAARE